MADVCAFPAIHYATATGDVTTRIAPPYDVLSEGVKQALLKRDPANIVAVDLPHTPPKNVGPVEAYQRAGELLRAWLAGGVLVRESGPAVYPYAQTFEHAGQRYVRRGFIARVRAEQFRASPAGIFPHEQTFSGPKEDRLALYRAARAQISPIFGLFPDDANDLTDRLFADLPADPMLRGRLGPVEHAVWREDRPARIDALVAGMRDRPIFIADGHHRYTTALNYLAELEKSGLPADDPARFVMFVCVSMSDPGLIILPTHRVLTVRRFDAKQLADRLAAAFDIRPTESPVDALEGQVLDAGPGTIGVKFRGESAGWLMRLKDAGVLDRFEPARGLAWRRLDVAILHRFIVQECLTPLTGEPAGIEYPHNASDVVGSLAHLGLDDATAFGTSAGSNAAGLANTKVAFLLAPTPLAAVRDVCLSGELMPQKSTFFHPKLATGLTLYDLTK